MYLAASSQVDDFFQWLDTGHCSSGMDPCCFVALLRFYVFEAAKVPSRGVTMENGGAVKATTALSELTGKGFGDVSVQPFVLQMTSLPAVVSGFISDLFVLV